jgi:hypothetical protein
MSHPLPRDPKVQIRTDNANIPWVHRERRRRAGGSWGKKKKVLLKWPVPANVTVVRQYVGQASNS